MGTRELFPSQPSELFSYKRPMTPAALVRRPPSQASELLSFPMTVISRELSLSRKQAPSQPSELFPCRERECVVNCCAGGAVGENSGDMHILIWRVSLPALGRDSDSRVSGEMMMMSFICSYRNKKIALRHIPLWVLSGEGHLSSR